MTLTPDRYVSTRGAAADSDFAEALLRGMAPDGGLYMPGAWPKLMPDTWAAGRGYAEMAVSSAPR